MKNSSFLIALKQAFYSNGWPWLLPALRQDAGVWNCLENSELGKRALKELPRTPGEWTPAALALLDMRYPTLLEKLTVEPIEELVAPLQRMGKRAFQDWQNQTGEEEISLGQAGLLAMTVRERFRLAGNWQDAFTGFKDQFASKPNSGRTVLVCLYGMVPTPQDLLHALLEIEPLSYFDPIDICLHTLLCTPQPVDAQADILKKLLADIPLGQGLAIIRRLAMLRPELSRLLAQSVLSQKPSRIHTPASDFKIQPPEAAEHMKRLAYLFQISETFELGGQPQQSLLLRIEALKAVRSLQAYLAAQLGSAADQAHDSRTAVEAWKQAAQLAPDSSSYAAGLALALLQSGRSEDASAYISTRQREEEQEDSPAFSLANALVAARQGETEQARLIACQTLASLEGEWGKKGQANTGFDSLERANFQKLPDFAQALWDLNCPKETIRAAELALHWQPQDPQVVELLARALLEDNRPEEALEAAYLALALRPLNRSDLELVVKILEAAGKWQAALLERNLLIREISSPTAQEYRSLAFCALQAGEPDQCEQACHNALKIDPEDGQAYALLGEARLALKDLGAATEYFHQAVFLAPQLPAPWLALAKAHRTAGEQEKAKEILSAAALAAPSSPEIHLELGEAYLSENAPTQALASFRKAANLLEAASEKIGSATFQENPGAATGSLLALRVSRQLGKTLLQLGHLEEAHQVLQAAYQSTALLEERDPELAYAYAQVLLAMGDLEKALEPLYAVIQAYPQDPLPALEYARASLKVFGSSPEAAQGVIPLLDRVLEALPEPSREHDEANALLAEALFYSGDLPQAREAYRQALDTALAQDPGWRARLSLALGRITLTLGQYEMAITALQEANQADPNNQQIQRSLSEAYLAAGLVEDAYLSARSVLWLNPTDLDTLTWFSRQVKSLPELPGSLQAEAQAELLQTLQKGVEIAPQRADFLLYLGQAYLQNGKHAEALSAFHSLVKTQAQKPDDESASNIEEAECRDLYQAAQSLRSLGEGELAVALLERAVAQQQKETSYQEQISPILLLTELSSAYRQAGNLLAALQALEDALSTSPAEWDLHLMRVELLSEMGQTHAALSSTDQALQLIAERQKSGLPIAIRQQAALHRKASLLLRALGDLPAALDHANLCPIEEGRFLAAELARAMLQPEIALKLLDTGGNAPIFKPQSVPEACLYAELALQTGDEVKSMDMLTWLNEQAIGHPRLLATQAYQLALQGEDQAALQRLLSALQTAKTHYGVELPIEAQENESVLPQPDFEAHAVWLSIGAAAVELAQWGTALEAYQQAVRSSPGEPLGYLELGRAYTLCAESQQLCKDLDIVRHAPGEQALSDASYYAMDAAFRHAEEIFSGWINASSGQEAGSLEQMQNEALLIPPHTLKQSLQEIQHWHARGEAGFYPSFESASALEKFANGPEDIAAIVAAYGRIGDARAALKASQGWEHQAWIYLFQGLAFALKDASQALHYANQALEEAQQNACIHTREIPYFQILPALLLYEGITNGKIPVEDLDLAFRSLQNALADWPDEARWHELGASLYRLQSKVSNPLLNLENAIQHLEKAANLEPDKVNHYLTLGKLYEQVEDQDKAIQALEKASRLAPDQAEVWFALAKAQQSIGDLDQAASSAERAIERANEPAEALMLRGEIALQANNPRGAQSRAQAVLRLRPEDPKALRLMARALEMLNRPVEALASLESAIAIGGPELPLLLERAHLIQSSKGAEAGLAVLQELASRFPEEAEVLAPLAQALYHLHRMEEAIQFARMALQAPSGDLTETTRSSLHLLVGQYLAKVGQLDQAIHHLNQSIQEEPGNLEAYLELGKVLQERRQHVQALKIYQQAIEIARDDYRPYYHAGLALKDSKDYEAAESMLRHAVELAPEEVGIHRLLAAVVALNLVHNRHSMPAIR